MTVDIALILAIAVVAMALFVTEKLRVDLVAILVLTTLAVLGLVTPGEALSGFSNEATITVAAMFVLAAGLQSSGALTPLGQLLSRSKSPTVFLLTLFGLLGLIGPFINNTAIVAVFMPLVIAASGRIGLSPTKSLIPLSYVAQMTGVCTLIGTSTNLIVNAMARDLGHRGFTMFEFLPLGAVCFLVGCAYLLTIGRKLLPEQGNTGLEPLRESGYYVTELRVTGTSGLNGTSVEEADLSGKYRVFALELWRDREKVWSPRSQILQKDDVLLVRGRWRHLKRLADELKLEFKTGGNLPANDAVTGKRLMAEVMISPNSTVAGHRLEALSRLFSRQTSILAIQRRGQIIRDQLDNTILKVGDILLVVFPEPTAPRLHQDRNFIVISERNMLPTKGWRAPFALLTMALVVILAATGVLSLSISAIGGALVMVLAGCLDADDLYDTIDWRILLLMAGLLPLGIAMINTGAASYLVHLVIGPASYFGPHVVLAILYLLALFLGETMSHAAAAVLLTPIGISTAQLVHSDPTPFLIAITFSASTSFLTPVGYQTNTMVYSAGGYRFTDFIKVGLPLNIIFWIVGVLLIPVFWPFNP